MKIAAKIANVVLLLPLLLAGCAPSSDELARALGRGIGEGLAAGLREGGPPMDPVAVGEAIGRGLARGAIEEMRDEQQPVPVLPQLPGGKP